MQRRALGTTQVLYLNFEGGAVVQAAVDDAMQDQSQLGGAAAYPPFDHRLAAAKVTRAQALQVIADRVRAYFAPYDLEVVTQRPSTGPYTMVMIGGRHTSLSPVPSSSAAGRAPLDCVDANQANLAFVFSDELGSDYGGLVAVASTAAHEVGHAYGLEHTDQPLDLMYSVATPMQRFEDLFSLSFATGSYSGFNAGSTSPQPEQCGRADPLDNHALLLAALGARPAGADRGPPTLSWSAPAAGSAVPSSFPVAIEAADDGGVARVELYRNFELVQVWSAPPFSTTLSGAPGETFFLTAEAVDLAGNRATLIRSIEVEVGAPPCDGAPCGDASPLHPTGGDLGAGEDRGCSMGGGGRGAGSGLAGWLLCGGLALAWSERARARRLGQWMSDTA